MSKKFAYILLGLILSVYTRVWAVDTLFIFKDTSVVQQDFYWEFSDQVLSFEIQGACANYELHFLDSLGRAKKMEVKQGHKEITEEERLKGICFCTSCTAVKRKIAHEFVAYRFSSKDCDEVELKLHLKPVKEKPWYLKTDYQKGDTIQLNQILFVGNMARFLPQSRAELRQLEQLMKNTKLNIHVQGHVNAPFQSNSPQYQALSHARAKAVVDYLINKGIAAERMTYQGFGNKQMLYPKTRLEEEMMLNRRVEIIIK